MLNYLVGLLVGKPLFVKERNVDRTRESHGNRAPKKYRIYIEELPVYSSRRREHKKIPASAKATITTTVTTKDKSTASGKKSNVSQTN